LGVDEVSEGVSDESTESAGVSDAPIVSTEESDGVDLEDELHPAATTATSKNRDDFMVTFV
jgi:hypothetical protein